MLNKYDMMNKHIAFLFLVLLLAVSPEIHSQERQNQTFLDYIERYKDMAIKEMEKYKIPASITLAQGLLESGAGRSELATKGNNHFGIKCGGGWKGRRMFKDDDNKNDCFRVYSNVLDSYEDHSRFLLRDRYKRLFDLKTTDYKGWARGLKACGYATLPTYADRLIRIIETYQLYEYDTPNKKRHSKKQDTQTAPLTNTAHVQAFEKHAYMVNNGVVCVKAMPGDTWESLSKSLFKSKRQLLKYNEAVESVAIQPGTFIYLKKKQKKAERKYKDYWHKVKPGESMYSISQLYGIRMKYLYKMNFKSADYSPNPGDILKVR